MSLSFLCTKALQPDKTHPGKTSMKYSIKYIPLNFPLPFSGVRIDCVDSPISVTEYPAVMNCKEMRCHSEFSRSSLLSLE